MKEMTNIEEILWNWFFSCFLSYKKHEKNHEKKTKRT